MIPLLSVSPGRNITEKLPDDELFITPASSDGDEHDSDFVSRNKGEPTNNQPDRINQIIQISKILVTTNNIVQIQWNAGPQKLHKFNDWTSKIMKFFRFCSYMNFLMWART